MISTYIRRGTGSRVRKVGFLIADRRKNGHVYIGWSKCNMGKDKFDPKFARELSLDRININEPGEEEPPMSIRKDILRFAARCVKYFQVTDIRIA